ncbi:MAG: TlpA family protein disulfide reductase [Deltaproteobacteria bacterium]|nr:TlpA family protein disulfide reductase [Deltaproteobacteria bacterium]MBW2171050.1 TlpA family protein disulfide reductase [Deltaproteobacteria bacterium]MBW2259407.1 TlpA family protein disulfide reductase [Deltaproteobacteria bacterium]
MVVVGGFLVGAVLFAQVAGPVHRIMDPLQFESFVSIKQLFTTGGIYGVPAKAPDLAITTIEGKPFKLHELTGQNQLVIVNFWATWCRPCIEEMPDMEKVHLAYQDKGVAFVGIAAQDNAWKVKEFLAQHKVTYRIAVDDQNEIANAFGGIKALPTTLFIDRENNIVKYHRGYLAGNELEKNVRKLLTK